MPQNSLLGYWSTLVQRDVRRLSGITTAKVRYLLFDFCGSREDDSFLRRDSELNFRRGTICTPTEMHVGYNEM